MTGMSRRDLLRASAGAAAVAVPMSVLSREVAGASGPAAAASRRRRPPRSRRRVRPSGAGGPAPAGPVIFSVLDASAGEVSILHGSSEVIVRDPQLVDRILRAARRAV